MAINSPDALIAGLKHPAPFCKVQRVSGVVGRPQSQWTSPGIPGAGANPAAAPAGVAITGDLAGRIDVREPGVGLESRLTRFAVQSGFTGTVLLCDRIWHAAGFSPTLTTAQAVGSVAFPARDDDGSVDGRGYQAALEVTTAMGAGTPTVTLGYTNSDGVAWRSAANIDSAYTAAPVGYFHRLGFQSGDKGIRSIQSVQLSSTWTSGAFNLVVYRILAQLEVMAANSALSAGPAELGLPKLHPGVCPFLVFIPAAAGIGILQGQVGYAHG